MTSMQIVDRENAVRTIGDALADRHSFVVTVPPEAMSSIGDRLLMVPSWIAYVDNGTEAILRADTDSRALDAAAMMSTWGVPAVAVVLVPKIVPAAKLSRALGQAIPADGSTDIVIVDGERGTKWPGMFVDALARVDPVAASQIRAAAVAE